VVSHWGARQLTTRSNGRSRPAAIAASNSRIVSPGPLFRIRTSDSPSAWDAVLVDDVSTRPEDHSDKALNLSDQRERSQVGPGLIMRTLIAQGVGCDCLAVGGAEVGCSVKRPHPVPHPQDK